MNGNTGQIQHAPIFSSTGNENGQFEGATMSITIPAQKFGRDRQQRFRPARLPRLALRQRSHEHPMVMFSVIVASAFLSMALIPVSGPAWASFGAPLRLTDDVDTTSKTYRLPLSETQIACRGQAWAAESADCLAVIAREAGREGARKVRMLASAEPMTHTPNIF